MRRLKYFRFPLWSVLFILGATALYALDTPAVVDRIEIHDTIQPISAARLDRALEAANRDHAAALLIDLDTPGGLLDSTRHMVGAMLNSPVPVIVYIAPSGARAGSAGFFLLEAADIAAMAPATNAGASHPVLASGTPDDTMRQKMENDAAAFLRSYTTRRNRNAETAEQAVRNSKSFSTDEALDQHLIDLSAVSDSALLAALDGKTITRLNGNTAYTQTLHLNNARILTLEPTIRERLLNILADPNIALLLLLIGGLLIYLEFNTPGTIVPGALGTVLVLLSIFSLNLLPIRHTAVLLLVAAAVLFLLEMKFASHGALAIGAIACLVLGTLTLVDAPIPEMAVHPGLAIGMALGFGILTAILLRLAIRAKRQKSLIGPAALVGFPATAMEPLAPLAPEIETLPISIEQQTRQALGRILVQGEIWQATSTQPVPAHTALRVTGFHGDVLEVAPILTEAPAIPIPGNSH